MPRLHITFMSEFPYTSQIIEHCLLEQGIADYTLRGQIGQVHLTLSDEDRMYAEQILDHLICLSCVSRVRMYTRQEGDYDRL